MNVADGVTYRIVVPTCQCPSICWIATRSTPRSYVQVRGVSRIICFFTLLRSVLIVGASCASPFPESFVCPTCRYGGIGRCEDLEAVQALVGRKMPSLFKRGPSSMTSLPDLAGRTSQRFFKVYVARSSLLERPEGILTSSDVPIPLSVALPLEFFTAVSSALSHDYAPDGTGD